MHLRVRQQAKNAQAVAEFLETHPKVDTVRYGIVWSIQAQRFVLAPLHANAAACSFAFCDRSPPRCVVSHAVFVVSHSSKKLTRVWLLHCSHARGHHRYPGLKSFPQKALADKQHDDGMHGGMLWFEVKGGSAAGRKLMDTVQRPWSLCENLGATESIITCPSVCAQLRSAGCVCLSVVREVTSLPLLCKHKDSFDSDGVGALIILASLDNRCPSAQVILDFAQLVQVKSSTPNFCPAPDFLVANRLSLVSFSVNMPLRASVHDGNAH